MAAERITIADVTPSVDCGRWPAKACVGDTVEVTATIVRDGHEPLRAVVRHRRPRGRWREEPLVALGNDRYRGAFAVDAIGRHRFEIEAWVDRHAGWLDEHDRKVAAGQADLAGELAEGVALFGDGSVDEWREAAPAARPAATVTASRAASPALEVDVERERARASVWYELFPRSWGGLAGVVEIVPELAELGFDVLYLPPIHPIGETNRKGRNNAERAAPGDVGSPWAIGGADGRARRDPPRSRHGGRPRGARRRAPRAAGWSSRSTSPSRPRPITPGSASIPSGSSGAPTAR